MQTSLRLPLLVAALHLLAACSGQPGAPDASSDARVSPAPRVICDGSDDLRVMVAAVEPSSERLFEGHRVLFENGSYVLVDGHCRFWVKPAENMFEEVRSGVLDTATLAEFIADLRYDDWPALQGSYPSDPSVEGAEDLIFVDRETSVTCVSNGLLTSTPAEVVAMREAQSLWKARLWAAGVAVTGDVRVSVLEYLRNASWTESWPPGHWSASVSIDTLAVPPDGWATVDYGEGALLTGADADALRALRADYLRRAPDGFAVIPGASIAVQDGTGPIYFVNVRDTTPFEDARGLVSWLSR